MLRATGPMTCMLCLALTATGCAQLTTYNSPIGITSRAVALDMKTRVVFTSESNVTCAEPSPDALTVIGVSGGLAGQVSTAERQAAANAAFGLSESGAFVGLRTQSIQLLRDAMYRACEGLASGKLSDMDYRSLHRRYQATMLALLAIEQVTQPVVAGQAMLLNSTSAGGEDRNDAELEKAQTALESKKSARLTAEQELDEARTAHRRADEALAAEKGKEADKQDAAELARLKGDLEDKANTVRDKERRLSEARKDESEARLAVITQRGKAQASTAGRGELGSSRGVPYAAATQHVAQAVLGIVDEAYDTFKDESCMDFVKQLLNPNADISYDKLEKRRADANVPRSGDPRNPSSSADAATFVMQRCMDRVARQKPEAPPKKPTTEEAVAMLKAMVNDMNHLKASLEPPVPADKAKAKP